METGTSGQQSSKPQIDELERRMNELDARARQASQDAQAHMRAQLDTLRARLDTIRRNQRLKEDANNRDEDKALAEVGHEVDVMYKEYMSWPTPSDSDARDREPLAGEFSPIGSGKRECSATTRTAFAG